MNKVSLILSLGAYMGVAHIHGSQVHSKVNTTLSPEETAVFQWFDKHTPLVGSVHKELPVEDQEFFNKKIPYKENPEAFTRATLNFATTFYKLATEKGLAAPFTPEALGSMFLKIRIAMQNKEIEKPTDLLTARLYVWSKLMTPQEKESVYRDNYLKNPEAAHAVAAKNGRLLAEELAKLNIIENTDAAKAQYAEEFTKKKIEDFKREYLA